MKNELIEKTVVWLNKEAKKVMCCDAIVTHKPVEYEEKTGMFIVENDDKIFRVHKTMVLSMIETKKNKTWTSFEVRSGDNSSKVVIDANGITGSVKDNVALYKNKK